MEGDNERLLSTAARLPIRLIDYGRSGEAYLDSVVRIARDLALPEPEAAARFYDDILRHQAIDETRPIPPALAHTYARLQALTL